MWLVIGGSAAELEIEIALTLSDVETFDHENQRSDKSKLRRGCELPV